MTSKLDRIQENANRYLVRNCPAFNPQAYEHCCNLDGNYKCEGCTDCVMKQIVDILRENTCKPEECGMNKPDWNGEVFGCNAGFDDNVSGCSCALANNLLRKLDIEEINK